MKCKFTLFITALLILICCIGAASAAEASDDTISADSDLTVVEQTDDANLQTDTADDTTLEVNNEETDNLRETSVTVNDWSQLAGNASSSGDKTINLADGQTYTPTSQIVFGNSATIVGTPTSYISGTYSGIPFVNNNRANSITFQNVNFKDMTCQMLMQMQTNGITILDGCTFTNIQTGTGHDSVIYNNWGTMNVTDCTFTNCKTGFGVITNYNWMSQTGVILNVKNSKFENNTASSEPGAINNCGVLTVYNCTFIKNNSTMWAGAIHNHYRANTIINKSTFKGNFAKQNGGALFTYSVLKIYNSIFEDNICNDTTGGGAIGSYNYISTYNILIQNSTFKGNRNNATGGHGGAITALNGGYLNVYYSTFVNNSAEIGLAICAFNQVNDENETGGNPRLAINGCTFENHTGDSDTVYAPGYVSSFNGNTFINSPQSTHFSGSGNTYNSINLPTVLMANNNDILASAENDILSMREVSQKIYVNISNNDDTQSDWGMNANDGHDWNTAYGTDNCLKDAFEYIDIGGTIIVADGTYTVAPDQSFILDNMYNNPFTLEGYGDNVVFSFDSVYNLDTGSNSNYGKTVGSTITHKKVIFDCDVKVGSKNFKFVDCTFNKGVEISRDYVSDDICNITFENCIFANPKSDIVVADKNNVVYNDCTFPVTTVDSKLSIANETNVVIVTLTDAEGNPIKGATVNYNTTSGVKESNITGEDGRFTISGLTGEFTINATYAGNESYNPSNNSASFNFKLPAVETTLSINSTEKGIVTITVKDAEGKPVANAEIKYNNGGENTTKTTNNEGIVTVSGLTGEGEIKAYFEGNDTYLKSEGSYKYNFTETTPTPDTNSSTNGTSGNGTSTNSTGNATSGNGTSTNTGKTTTNTPKVTKKATKITAKKATFKAKKKTKKYTIVLKAGKKAVKKVKVTLKVGKKTYKATTNSKGKATFKITKLNKKGKYTAVIKFKGNKNFKATSKKVKITVKK